MASVSRIIDRSVGVAVTQWPARRKKSVGRAVKLIATLRFPAGAVDFAASKSATLEALADALGLPRLRRVL